MTQGCVMALSIWGSHQTLWSLPLPNVTWHSGTWPYTMTHSIDQTLHQFANLLPNWTLLPILTLLPNFGGFHRTLATGAASQQRTLTPSDTWSCPIWDLHLLLCWDILSWNCHFYGPFEFRTSLGSSILPLTKGHNWKVMVTVHTYQKSVSKP